MYKSWKLTIDLKNVGRCRSVSGAGRVVGSETLAQIKEQHQHHIDARSLKGASLGEEALSH
jgi:hypothetical protein